MPTIEDYHLPQTSVNLSSSSLPPELHETVTSALGSYTCVTPPSGREVRGTLYEYPDGEREITSLYIHDADIYDNKPRGRVNSFNPMTMAEGELHQRWLKDKKTTERLIASWKTRYERNRLQASKSARTRIRRLIQSAGLDYMVTLTTRNPVTDVSDMFGLVESFMRLVRSSIGDYKIVGVPQVHPSNPENLHVHLAVKGWQKLSLLRRCWHKVLKCPVSGDYHDNCGDLSPGGVNVRAPKARGGSQWGSAALSGYLSRYITDGGVQVGYRQKRYMVSHHIGIVARKFRYSLLDKSHLPSVVAGVLCESLVKFHNPIAFEWFSCGWGEGVYACTWH